MPAGATLRVPAPAGRRLIFAGASCNNRCVFCPQALPRGGSGNVAADLEASAGMPIGFVGGEPTLHADLPHWLRRAVALDCLEPLLQTNGRRLAYRDYTRELADAGLHSVDISLHGSRAPVHEYHTNVPESFAQTVRGIRNAVRAGLRVGISSVVTRSNVRHTCELVRAAARLGAGAIHFALAQPRGSAAGHFDRLVPRLQTTAPRLGAAATAGELHGVCVLVSGAPLCALTGIEDQALEHHIDSWPQAERFAQPCRTCALRSVCPGVEPAYLARFGAAELRAPSGAARGRVQAVGRLREAAARFCGVGVPLPDPAGPLG